MIKRAKIVLSIAVVVLSMLPLGCGTTDVGVSVTYGPGPWVGGPYPGGIVVVAGRPPVIY